MMKLTKKGFTLVEIVIVIGILAVLFGIALVAINPARQFSLANNTKRQSNVTAILDAIGQYMAANRGALPAGITTSPTEIRKSGGVDLCSTLVSTYLGALPVDPLTSPATDITNCSSSYTTSYRVSVSASDNRVTVDAPRAELGQSISVTR
jgi:prepilin-type N-terminal cleavage/methylation domain-containing protein